MTENLVLPETHSGAIIATDNSCKNDAMAHPPGTLVAVDHDWLGNEEEIIRVSPA
jgi:hypothetical protein